SWSLPRRRAWRRRAGLSAVPSRAAVELVRVLRTGARLAAARRPVFRLRPKARVSRGPHNMTTRQLAIDGGVPLRSAFLQFHKPLLGPEEEASMLETMRSGWLSTGPK